VEVGVRQDGPVRLGLVETGGDGRPSGRQGHRVGRPSTSPGPEPASCPA